MDLKNNNGLLFKWNDYDTENYLLNHSRYNTVTLLTTFTKFCRQQPLSPTANTY